MNVKVKICGITNLGDALCAARAGADFLGFIFHPPSPRYVSPASARAIVFGLRAELRQASGSGVILPRLVGVFVNEQPDAVARILDYACLDLAQLHGDEPPDSLRALNGRSYKAIRPQPGAADLEKWGEYASLGISPGPSILVDAYSTSAYGGTGHLADWSTSATLADAFPGMLLAGGLNPHNVTSALEAVQPWGIDVSSGVETSPGLKDHGAVAALIAAVRTFTA